MASSARNHRLYLFIILSCFITSSSGQEPESTLLLKFKSSLENATSSLGNWNSSVHLCNGNVSNWNGLLCFNGKFIGLRLESMGLSGNLDVDTLSQLTNLRTISVINNNFEGPFPDVKKIGGRLRGVYLSNNRFSGELPDDAFAGMKSIRRVLMANNEFTGKIPTSLLAIPKLVELYQELPTLTLPHGHLKSSNVLLDHKLEPLVADYALVPVINKDHAKQFMVAYKSPEYMQNERLTRKTDVWSLGILILELLTGRFPANYLKQGKGANADLAMWVNSVVREEWTGEVFDKDMNTTKHNCEGEMLKLLKIGMCCCGMDVARRWDLMEAVHKIEQLKESDEEDYSSSYYYPSEEHFSFSKNA